MTAVARTSGFVPGDAILHPLSLAAIGLLVLNDHVLKHTWPGFVTGKLSDFAGLAFFPLFLQAVWEVATRSPSRSRRVAVVAIIATGIAFALVKTWAPANEAYRWCWGAAQWVVRSVASGRTTSTSRSTPVSSSKQNVDSIP